MRLKNIFFYGIVALYLIFLVGIINATVLVGNKSHSIETIYGQSQTIKGWINISLKNESAGSSLSCFNQNISIKDFLDKTSGPDSYFCIPSDCDLTYAVSGNDSSSKTFPLGIGGKKTIGIRLPGTRIEVIDFYFNVSSDSKKSCRNPIKIDVLDDGLIEWSSTKIASDASDSYCQLEDTYGCFERSRGNSSTFLTEGTSFCENINLTIITGAIKIGAVVIGNGSANFKMSLTIGTKKECSVSINSTGEISCILELDSETDTAPTAEICIESEDATASTYKINYEDNQPCGYSISSSQSDPHDFEIFAKPIKYAALDKFRFDQDLVTRQATGEQSGVNLASEITDWINSRYLGNCTPECVIPIKFSSGVSQRIEINNLVLKYKANGLQQPDITRFYDASKVPSVISTDFIRLDLEKAGFKTPNKFGDVNFSLVLGNKTIFYERINLKKIPIIRAVTPDTASALVPTRFIVFTEVATTNLTYTWNFGENVSTDRISTDNSMKYTYSSIGDYYLTVKASNDLGGTSKTVKISVVAPKQGINQTIKEYKAYLRNASIEVNKFPDWIKSEIVKKVDVDDLDRQLKAQEEKFRSDFSNDEYIKTMQNLLGMKIPKRIYPAERLNPSSIVLSESQFNVEALEDFGAGALEGEEADYFNAVNNWIRDNLDTKFEYNTYVAEYPNLPEEVLFTDVKLSITPKETLGEFYLIVNGNPSKIKFDPELSTKDFEESASGIVFSDIGAESQQKIEFLYPEKIDLNSIPIFISPQFINLEITASVGPCNNNGKCEKDLNENYKNCRPDCKPWAWTLMFLAILLIIAFIIYIAMQEWYKRYYESYLFENRAQLFNLINFMSNSSNQGMSKQQIFEKLKDYHWTKEQMEYAWKRLKGERTGMWEIPVFKVLEKKKLKQELEKRQANPSLNKNPPNNSLLQRR